MWVKCARESSSGALRALMQADRAVVDRPLQLANDPVYGVQAKQSSIGIVYTTYTNAYLDLAYSGRFAPSIKIRGDIARKTDMS